MTDAHAEGPHAGPSSFAAEVMAAEVKRGPRGRIDTYLDGLADDERADVERVLLSSPTEYPHASVARALRDRGCHATGLMVQRWREANG